MGIKNKEKLGQYSLKYIKSNNLHIIYLATKDEFSAFTSHIWSNLWSIFFSMELNVETLKSEWE